ncbi:MAG TPA: MBL fold metallo-hydrolase [Spirochaetota bacterium]|nr:MBL fold metallo-hydrolase [Spirochaetota bacterium]
MIKFIGGASKVTGSAFLLETGNAKILIDCGIEQEKGIEKDNNEIIEKKINEIGKADICILTHAHLDHSGLVPLLVKKRKVNKIISTPATKELCRLLFNDFQRIQEENNDIPLYSYDDIESSFEIWDEIDDRNTIELFDTKITFYNNSHIIGSVSVFIETHNGNYLFSGDIGSKLQQLMDYPPDMPDGNVDYLILESTYGNKSHDSSDRDRLLEIAKTTCENGGKVLIPSFAIGRLQEVLYTFSNYNFNFPVYIDSPMGSKVTNLIKEYNIYLKKKLRRLSITDDLFNNKYIAINTSNQSKELSNSKEPAVIISASGMLEGGRILNHLEQIKNDENSTLIFVGYQAQNTRGRKILDGEEKVRCRIEKLNSFSAHADQDELIDYIERLKYTPYKVFLVHGEKEQREILAKRIISKKIRVELPENYSQGKEILIEKKVVLNINTDNMCNFASYRLMPFSGFIVEKDDRIEINDKNWFDMIWNEEYNKMRSQIVAEDFSTDQNEDSMALPDMSHDKIIENIEYLFNIKILSKNRIKEFWEEFCKGQKAAIKYITQVHRKNPNTGRRNWNPPEGDFTDNEIEKLYETAYNTLLSLIKYDKSKVYNILINFNPKL